jgi:hypothetical protein
VVTAGVRDDRVEDRGVDFQHGPKSTASLLPAQRPYPTNAESRDSCR